MPTQAALYDDLAADLHLSWSETELPERERTKHVHRLHPYLGKFVPHCGGALERYFSPGEQCLDHRRIKDHAEVPDRVSGRRGRRRVNCLLIGEDAEYDRPPRAISGPPWEGGDDACRATEYCGMFRARRRRRLLRFRSIVDDYEHADVLRVVLAEQPAPRAHDPLRPRLPASTAARAVLVPQAPADLHSRAGGREVPQALPARHARAARRVSANAHPRTQRPSRSR